MKKNAFFGMLCITAALGFFSCYTDSNYEEQEDEDTLQLKEEQEDKDSLQLKNITMKKIEEGSFKLGDDTKTVSSFYMAETETTQKLYNTIMGTHESSVAGDNYPVDKVSFYAALVFCNKLSVVEGLEPVYKKGNSTDADTWDTIPTADNAEWNAITEDSSKNGFRLPHIDEWTFAALGNNAGTFDGKDKNYYAGCIGKEKLSEYA